MESWDPGYPLARRHASASLLVGEWHCRGALVPVAGVEVSHHFEVSLQRLGVHARQTGAERAVADPAHAVLQRAGDRYTIIHPVGQPERSLILQVSETLVAELTRARPLRRGVPLSPRAAVARLGLARELGGDPLAVEDAALQLLGAVLDDGDGAAAPGGKASPAQRTLVEGIQHQLARRYRDRVTLDEVARAAGVSTYHASRVFRRALGVPMHRYLTRLRLYAALDALDEERGRWSQLALEVGFASHSHFTGAFVRELGRPPSAFSRRRGSRRRVWPCTGSRRLP